MKSVKRSKRTAHSTKSNFSNRHGSKAPIHSVGGEQLGHDAQLPVNPPTQGGSPLQNPGSPDQLGVSMSSPTGEEFY